MNSETYAEVTSIFQAACQLPPDAREAFLDEQCPPDRPAIRAEVNRLLALDLDVADDSAPTTDISLSAAFDAVERRDRRTVSLPGRVTRVGRYVILDEIGRGGMGVVYRAQQDQPRRDIAIKLIDPTRLSPAAARRFQTEAELLGRLQHPGIAQIFEAGAAETRDDTGHVAPAHPFIAMELIDGEPLLRAMADEPIDARMQMLASICDAVHHAHQQGVIHLDLKPGNVLVGADRRARVLDFGVARALDGDVERTLDSADLSAIAGTLAYMAREQIAGNAAEIDTRADIHALGAIGYELLAGRPPHDIQGANLIDAMHIVLTSDPPPLLTVNPDVDPELAAVIDKAIHCDKEERYASASALANDITRWLRHEPVAALPDHWRRRTRLFVRRNRTLTAAAGVASFALLGAVLALVFGLMRARAAEAEAEHQAEMASLAQLAAEKETQNARAMSNFLEKILFGVDPETEGDDLSFFDAIDYTAGRVHRDLEHFPEVEASVRGSLGIVYRRHSMYDKADGHLRQSLRLRRAMYGDEHVETAKSLIALSNHVFEHAGRLEESLLMLEQAERILLTEHAADDLAIGWLDLDLGLVRLARDDLGAAEGSFHRCAETLGRHFGATHPDVSRPLRGLALVALAHGDLTLAEEYARAAVERCAGWEDQEYIGARAKLVLGEVLLQRDAIDEAAAVLAEAEASFRRLISARHIRTAEMEAVMAELRRRQGDLDRARTHARACLELRRRILDPRHWEITAAELEEARIQLAAGEAVDAGRRINGLFETAERTLGPDHRLTVEIAVLAANAWAAAGDPDIAQTWSEAAAVLQTRRSERLRQVVVPIH